MSGGAGLDGPAAGGAQHPDGLDGAGTSLGYGTGPSGQGSPGGSVGIQRVGLALSSASPPVRPVDLDQLDLFAGQVAGQARAVGAGALHPDLDHATEAAHPGQQGPVPGRGGRELVIAQFPPILIQHCRVMSLAVSVHSAHDGSLLRCHAGLAVPSFADERGRHARPGSGQHIDENL